jgi:hypothetical protein
MEFQATLTTTRAVQNNYINLHPIPITAGDRNPDAAYSGLKIHRADRPAGKEHIPATAWNTAGRPGILGSEVAHLHIINPDSHGLTWPGRVVVAVPDADGVASWGR